jgi:hypothetical protein
MMFTPRWRRPERFQDLVADLDLFDRIGRQLTRIVSPMPIHSRLPSPMADLIVPHQPARLGDAQVDRRVGGLGDALVGGGGQEHVGGLAR